MFLEWNPFYQDKLQSFLRTVSRNYTVRLRYGFYKNLINAAFSWERKNTTVEDSGLDTASVCMQVSSGYTEP